MFAVITDLSLSRDFRVEGAEYQGYVPWPIQEYNWSKFNRNISLHETFPPKSKSQWTTPLNHSHWIHSRSFRGSRPCRLSHFDLSSELTVDAASKSALHYGFLFSLKNEIVKIHPQGRANVVAPGWVRYVSFFPIWDGWVDGSTPMALESLKIPGIKDAALATTPLKKIARPEDITGTICFLASWKLSGHITGEIITMCL